MSDSEFVLVRIPETGALWRCHPMTAEAHDLVPLTADEAADALGQARPLPVADPDDLDDDEDDDPEKSEPAAT